MRVLLDSNIFISYLLNPHADSLINHVVKAGILGEFTILLPELLLEEFTARIETKPYLSQHIKPEELAQLNAALLTNGETIPPIIGVIPAMTRDPKDDYLLAYAVVGDADYLVTGDKDLLTLIEVQGVKICRPREFAEEVLAP